ncbi:MAG: hypothetical protein EKK41_06670 [Hyphomicrobiales bacterium]|jgi:hypothetical protein|nr:MAG: hypothetical protein EKK41_06670 [Hyphomicrobiales bacterium]
MVQPVPQHLEAGLELFLAGSQRPFGAVLAVGPTVRIYVENAGEFDLAPDAIVKVHDDKVIVDGGKLSGPLADAVLHAHDAEDRD